MSIEHPQHAPHRTRLAGLGGRKYWRSLDELTQTPEFQEFLEREFPEQASTWSDPLSRRSFMKLMAASLALAGLTTGCIGRGKDEIVPYVEAPEQVVPGKPLYFATAMPLWGYGMGVIVESHMGRPTKIEGNPHHPASLGGTNPFMQASVLSLWDPDRAQTVTQSGNVSVWDRLVDQLNMHLATMRPSRGDRVRILTGTVTSPTLVSQIQQFLQQYPEARWHHYEPASPDGPRQGSQLAFGRAVNTIYHFDRAQRILSLDSNFLFDQPGSLRYARQFIDGRRIRSPKTADGQPSGMGHLEMNRLYMLQSTPVITGAMADHRLVMPAGQIENVARAIAGQLGVSGIQASPPPAQEYAPWIAAMVQDLKQHAALSLLVPGEFQTPAVHALAHAMNAALGSIGSTVTYTEPVESHPDSSMDSLRQLVSDMNAGLVDLLVIIGANPVFSAPADLDFTAAMQKVKLRIHQSLHYNETSFYCHWHVPESHYLESWGDVRAFDGTASIIQPLIAPLYASRSAHQLLAAMLGNADPTGLASVQDHWRPLAPPDFNQFWVEALRMGIVPNTALPPIQPQLQPDFLSKLPPTTAPAQGTYEIIFRPDPTIWDGEFANNGWLMELPKPLTKLTWDNPALISPAMAQRLGLQNEQIITLRHAGLEMRIPVWITPAHPDNSISLYLGGGRQRAGRVGTATGDSGGFNVYALRTSANPWIAINATLASTATTYRLASTQNHQIMNAPAEELIRSQTIGQFVEQVNRPAQSSEAAGPRSPFSLYPNWDYSSGHQWGMVIDNNACISCNACVTACQAENNIPIVGKSEVLNSRQMLWIRIDTYYEGEPENNPNTYFEPLPCMHCETAPCEVVCPVGATTHSVEGVNEMTYNRCVGTRYCSNNCPYKVRRFNFYRYSDVLPITPVGHNPDVTIRARGVMEKCTYCIQRINGTRISLKVLQAQRDAIQGEQEKASLGQQMDSLMSSLTTACAQACPTGAIIFGDLHWRFTDPQKTQRRSEVYQLKQQPQNFGILTSLNTQPRTTYLPKFFNPNPQIPVEQHHG
ncbi:MAG TPA: TAT-variant-translocated molybdopterin oxidoreductase [Tepidisphaeraceae bacterium]|nr:TAT-variant-translocated molybdopterin oxidoreductase [Tepidisphaeraceae bacterium]